MTTAKTREQKDKALVRWHRYYQANKAKILAAKKEKRNADR